MDPRPLVVPVPKAHSPKTTPTGAQPEFKPDAEPLPAASASAPVPATIRQVPSAVCKPEESIAPRCSATRAVSVPPSAQT
jgi:hypothetical protein